MQKSQSKDFEPENTKPADYDDSEDIRVSIVDEYKLSTKNGFHCPALNHKGR
tara:strand:+ start:17785 stop:17940 length:156 start_codon:yes stop_codon:yes gene_type:complete